MPTRQKNLACPLPVNVSSGAVAMNPCKLIWVRIVTV
jgi:hypothetical protein